MVDVLTTKIIAWENERGKEFTYDGVCLFTDTSFLNGVCFSFFLEVYS